MDTQVAMMPLDETHKTDSLKSLWKLVFADSDEFTDYYFQHYDSPDTRLARFQSSQAVAQLHMHPFSDSPLPGAYIYGLATHPQFRHRGLARRLLTDAFYRMRQDGIAYAVLIPAEQALLKLYTQLGFAIDNHPITVTGQLDNMDFALEGDPADNIPMYRVVNIQAHMQAYAALNPSRYSLFGVDDPIIPENSGIYSVKDGKVNFFNGRPDFATLAPERIFQSFPVPHTINISISQQQ